MEMLPEVSQHVDFCCNSMSMVSPGCSPVLNFNECHSIYLPFFSFMQLDCDQESHGNLRNIPRSTWVSIFLILVSNVPFILVANL